jgi:hypothetical protein
MMAQRLHHRGYSLLWDLLDLWRSAFHHTGSLTSRALLPFPVRAAAPPSTPPERLPVRVTERLT